MRTLTLEEARAFYDRFGSKQDRQSFYEAPALRALAANSRLAEAQCVFEFGCGTGRFALELLREHLPTSASYLGIDISTTMVRVAADRLAIFPSRASVALASPSLSSLPVPDASHDRFISTYVLDLLSDVAAHQVLLEAKRILRPGGLLCLAGVTHGTTRLSRLVMAGWQWLFAANPSWVGGCRPTSLSDSLATDSWHVRFHQVVVAWGIASEVLVASSGRGTETDA